MNTYLNNTFVILALFVAALASGCATWSGPRGRGRATPFEWSAEADTAMSACQDSRQRQRRELLCDAGILSGARCGGEVSVSYRDSVRLICEQSDSREAAGESRAISREDCERMLSREGIPADATGTVRSEAPATADPMMQRIIAMNPALWQDDHAFCIAITSGYGSPTAGGMLPVGGVPVGSIGGTVPGLSVGLLGSTVGVPGVGGFGGTSGRCTSSSPVPCYEFDATGNPYAIQIVMTPVGGGAGSTFIVQPRSRLPVPVSRAIRYHVTRECVTPGVVPGTWVVTARLPDVIVDPTQSPFPMAITQYICESPAYRL